MEKLYLFSKRKNYFLIAFLVLFSFVGKSQILTFDFEGLAGTETTAASNSNATGITASVISRGSGIAASGNADRFNATGWTTSTSVDVNDYVQFTVSPSAGYQFSISSIVVQVQRSGTGPRAIALRSSVDNYAANLGAAGTITDNTSTQSFTFTFSKPNGTAPVTYRIYLYNAEAAGGTGGPGDGSGNDIIVNGTATTTATSYTVTFNSNGGTGTMANQTASSATALTANTFTRTSYTFTGWNTAANGSGTAYANGASYPFTANATLYAQWKPVIVISEYMYNGLSAGSTGEFVEFTNISTAAVDMTGWSFDDNSRIAGSVSLTGFGIVQPGESVILTDLTAAAFRTVWGLCAAVKVIGGNAENIARADEINLYNSGNTLVDRLTYDDQTLGGPRTQNVSAWPSATSAGTNTSSAWTLSSVGDSESSYTSTVAETGNPGISTLGEASFIACPPLVPEINVQGNANNITSGSTTISTAINTDFGNVNVTAGTSTRTYTIQNTGTASLTISGISFTGANNADFTLSPVPAFPLNIAASGSTTFSVSFDPGAIGARNAVVNIANTDANENPYTFAIRGNGINNSSSDIINDVSYAYTSNINYLAYQGNPVTSTANGIGVMRLTIRDGGAAATDTDGLGTELTAITFNVANIANLRSAALFGGTTQSTLINNAPVINTGAGTITFTGLSGANVTAANNSTSNITLRVSFLTAVTDNQQLQFTVASATAAAAGSAFAASNAGGAGSSVTGDINRIEVTADRLAFIQQPANTSQSVNMTPAVTVAAVDININRDLDFVSGPVNITSTGTLNTSPQTASPAAGLATFSTINHTLPGNGLQLTAAYTGLLSASSTLFNITDFAYQNGDYQPSVDYTTFATNGAWEVYNAGVWTGGQTAPQNLAAASRPNRIIINRPGINGGGNSSNAYKTIIVSEGGELLLLNNANPTVDFISSGNKLEVQSGGSVVLDGQIEMNASANLIVKSGGSFTLNNVNIGNDHVFWDGIENFEPGSVFNILNHANNGTGTSSLINVYNRITDNATGAKFGDLNIDFNPSTSDWTIVGGANTVILCDNLNVANNNAGNTITMFSNNNSPAATIRGNVNHTAGIFALSGNFSGTTTAQTLNIDGNLSSTGGTLQTYFSGGGSAANININLKGNLAVSGTAFTSDINNSTKINFMGTALQTISVVPNCSFVNLHVKTGSGVQLQNQNLNFNGSCLFTVESNATFDFGFNGTTALKINQAGGSSNSFTSASGSYLKITHPNGLNTNTGGLGNLENLPASGRNVNTQGTFHYMGKAPAQQTGNALTTSSNSKVVIVELDAPGTTLTLTNGTGITAPGRLEITEGTLISAAANPITSTGTLVMTGGVYQIGELNVTAPQLTGAYTLSNNSTIELNGAGNQVLRGARAYRNLTFSASGTKTLTSAPASVTGTITIANTAVLNVGTNTMGGAGTNLTMTGTSRYITAGTGVKPDATGDYTLNPGTTIEFTNTEATLQKPRLTNPVPAYANIEVSGTNVGTDAPGTGANSFIQFGTSGNFIVNSTGTFKLANIYGFSGASNTAISNTNDPAISLQAGSTIEYNGSSPDHQLISNQTIGMPATTHYVNLKLSGTANKTAPAGTLAISGNLDKTGTGIYLHGNGTILFNGTLAQAYNSETPVMDFYNFTNSNTTGLNINSNLSIAKELLTGAATAKLNLYGGNITLKSTAVGTANVAVIPGGASIAYPGAGRFIVERYIGYTRRWQLLSVPANTDQTIFNSWQESGIYTPGYGVKITGPAGGSGLDLPVSNSASMKYQAGLTSSFTGITNTNDPVAGKLSNIKGYMLFVYGDRSSGAGTPAGPPTTLRTTGKLFVGNPSAGTDQPAITSVTAAFGNLISVGNPFASPVGFVALRAANPGIANNYLVWDPSNQGNYGSGIFQSIAGAAANLPTPGGGSIYNNPATDYRFIQSGQAFYVQSAVNGTVNVSFAEGMKNGTSFLANRGEGEANPADLHMISTFIHRQSDGRMLDGNRVVLDDQYSDTVNSDDAFKMMNDGTNLGISKQDFTMAVEARPGLEANDTIRYFINNISAGNYQFRLAVQNINEPLLKAEMIDRFTNSRTPVSLTDSSFINFTVTNDVASRAANRFYLVFKETAGGPLPVSFVNIAAGRQADRSIRIKWQVENEINIVRYEVERSADGSSFTGLLQTGATGNRNYGATDLSPLGADNFYRIKAIGLAGDITYSAIVKVAPAKEPALIAVTPNPVKNKQLNIRFVEQLPGDYYLQLSNAIGQVVYKGAVTIESGNMIKNIGLPAETATGNYQLSVRNKQGEIVHSQSLLVE